ncbi:MAG: hypothetical protein AB7G23_01250 [Vicinamibacterales bacterium]
MGALNELAALVRSTWAGWRAADLGTFGYWHRDDALLLLGGLLAVTGAVLLLRLLLGRGRAGGRVALPAMLARFERPGVPVIRQLPLLLVLAGLPWFGLALADPYSSLTRQDTTYPGRRICLMIDASSSMVRQFEADTLRLNQSPGASRSQASFFTTVAAARRFVELRRDGRYRDLMALVEFGDQAYVVTPFTSDYDNVLLSLSLIGDFSEFVRFPDQGTILTRAVEQGIALYDSFDFLDAAGNLMVLFSDGEDSAVIQGDTRVADVVQAAAQAEVPIYFVRTRFQREFGALVSDTDWRTAVEATGGRFYAAADEAAILRAIQDIDALGAGEIELNQYVTQTVEFPPFALIAAACWSLAALLKLTIPHLRRFP